MTLACGASATEADLDGKIVCATNREEIAA